MQTLNQIAENIAYKLGDQFNMTLRESLKDTILNYRAKFIRDDLDRNSLSDIHFVQTLNIQFEEVDLLNEFGANFEIVSAICDDVSIQSKYKVLRSKNLIPTPVRTKIASRNPFVYFGRLEGSKAFTYTRLDMFRYIRLQPYNHHTIYYTVLNNWIYILNSLIECDITNSLGIHNAMLRSIFEDPREAYTACSDRNKFMDDRPFPIGRDMLMQITNGILKGEYPLVPKDGEIVNIKPDKTDDN